MLTLLLLTSILAILLALFYKKVKTLPPGPLPLPLIGNLPQLAYMQYRHGGIVNIMKEWQKLYGPVFTIWLGTDPTVHICDLELAQESMVKRGHDFVDRWAPTTFNKLFGIEKIMGIIFSSGPFWSEQRRFMLHSFRNIGLGRGVMEERIMMEYNLRKKDLNGRIESGESEFEAFPLVELLVGSIINRILFNERLEKADEEKFFRLREENSKVNTFEGIDFLAAYDIFWKIPYLKNRWHDVRRILVNLQDFLREQIRDRVKAIERGDHIIGEIPEDYVDSFLVKMKEEKDDPNSFFTEEALMLNLFDLWQAGQDTTSLTILTGLVHMLNKPKVMTSARKELLQVTEGKRHLSLTDKKHTPYLNALLVEVQRHANLVLLNFGRQCPKDTFVGGHLIPENTPIAAEVSVIMQNDKLFEEAAMFNPERFLGNEELEKHVLPFGLGKRACPGESLARAELYLVIGNLLLDYEFERIGGETLSDFEHPESFFKGPPKFSMRIKKIDNGL